MASTSVVVGDDAARKTRPVVDEKRYVIWTREIELKLLKLWRSRQCLFDPTMFVTRSERQEAMAQLAVELGVTGLL